MINQLINKIFFYDVKSNRKIYKPVDKVREKKRKIIML